MSVSNLVSSIKTRIATVATGFTELAYSRDLSKNSFKDSSKRYGVNPKTINEQSGIIRHLNLIQNFEVILTQGFINTAMSDSQEQTKAVEIQDLAQSIYKDLVNTKCGDSSVIQVNSLNVETPETVENTVIQKFNFNVTYRITL